MSKRSFTVIRTKLFTHLLFLDPYPNLQTPAWDIFPVRPILHSVQPALQTALRGSSGQLRGTEATTHHTASEAPEHRKKKREISLKRDWLLLQTEAEEKKRKTEENAPTRRKRDRFAGYLPPQFCLYPRLEGWINKKGKEKVASPCRGRENWLFGVYSRVIPMS